MRPILLHHSGLVITTHFNVTSEQADLGNHGKKIAGAIGLDSGDVSVEEGSVHSDGPVASNSDDGPALCLPMVEAS